MNEIDKMRSDLERLNRRVGTRKAKGITGDDRVIARMIGRKVELERALVVIEPMQAEVERLQVAHDDLQIENTRLEQTYGDDYVAIEQERDQLKAEVERLRALWKKETERAHAAEGELLKSRVRLVTRKQERDQLKAQINSMKQAIDDLVRNSEGVAGLHQNGDAAPWDELLTGGRFGEWLCVLDDTPQQCLATHDAEVIERLIADCAGPHEGFNLPGKQWLQDYANQLRQKAKEVTSDPDS